MLTGAVQQSVLCQTLILCLREYPRARTRIVRKQRSGRVSSTSEHPHRTVVEVRSRSHREHLHESWRKYVRPERLTCMSMHKAETRGTREGKVTLSSAGRLTGRLQKKW